MKLSKSDFNVIKELLSEKKIVRGRKFIEKIVIQKLKLNGSISLSRVTAQRYEIELLKEENIFSFLKSIDYLKISPFAPPPQRFLPNNP